MEEKREEVSKKENKSNSVDEEVKKFAEIGRRYLQKLRESVRKYVILVEGESHPLLSLLEKADIETLERLAEEYEKKAMKKYSSSAKSENEQEPQVKLGSPEDIWKISSEEFFKLRERIRKEVD